MNADKEHKEIVDRIRSDPNHRKEKAQIHAVSGLGVTGVLGSVGLDALDFFGDNVAEFIGGGTGVGIICLLYTSPSPRDATLSRMPWCG